MASDVTSMRSRYKDTSVFTGDSGAYYGVLQTPAEFEAPDATTTRRYAVVAADVGFPDRIMVTLFGYGFEDLWWVVMLVNGLIDPETDLFPGRVLVVPSMTEVRSFLARV